MLRALGEPLSFAVLLLAFVVAITFAGWLSAVLAARQGQRSLRQEGRTKPDPRRQIDPFSAIAVVLGGLGWPHPTEVPRRSAGRTAITVLTGPLLLVAAGLGLLAGYAVVRDTGPLPGAAVLLREGLAGGPAGDQLWVLSGLTFLYVGALSVLPLPPLPGGQVLFAAAPRSPGWQKAEHQLVERNIGTVVLLALVLIPLGGPDALAPNILDSLLGPLVELVTGG